MKNIKFLILPCLVLVILSCRQTTDCNHLLKILQTKYNEGNLTVAVQLADSIKKFCKENEKLYREADSLAQVAERIRLDFSVSEEQINQLIEKKTGPFSSDDMLNWEHKGWLEWKLIDGKKMYFNRAASNLMLLINFYEHNDKWLKDIAEDRDMIFRLKHTAESFNASGNQHNPVNPVNFNIKYTISVNSDAVPDGEIIKCWMPFPKENHPRQQKTELISVSEERYILAPDSAVHRSVYMETKSKKGVPTVFEISFRYQSRAQHFNINDLTILPYDRGSDIYKRYTSEQLPQICFTKNIRHLADSITGSEDRPEIIVRKIYMWFKENIPWTGALEYSTMPNIPEYVYQNRRGDCGMQTFLYMSMLRYKGIPVRWQSGWMVPPYAKNLHDWCEVYFEGVGWVPSDVSYDLQKSEIPGVREFYLSGIDSYRLIVNDNIGGKLFPEKQFMRSEPFDFQRGEVEWKGGNIYFDKWDYNMEIEYLK